jgi:hypothetical protein
MQVSQAPAMPLVPSVWPERELLRKALVLADSATLTAGRFPFLFGDGLKLLLAAVSLRLPHRAATSLQRLLNQEG